MKKIRIIGLLVLLMMILSVPKSFAQVEKIIEENYVFNVKVTNRTTGEIFNYELIGVELIKVNNIGKILRTVTFRLSDNDIMVLANPSVRFTVKSVTFDFDGDGEPETLDGQYAVLTNNGNLKLVYHSL
ncbi:hypothetical protein [Maribellus sediminis]|uniref:hypothetical protein n=1 Tax=Maribellus sediminis TaxID=2696285 RepID=UPI0014321E18|nr:hypothetical protein [Maribellus sediminis]